VSRYDHVGINLGAAVVMRDSEDTSERVAGGEGRNKGLA
jgi:hypothetical protein